MRETASSRLSHDPMTELLSAMIGMCGGCGLRFMICTIRTKTISICEAFDCRQKDILSSDLFDSLKQSNK
jgi:hypothetical protein